MKTYIINIEFNSNKYNEQGVLTYKTIAESREQAEENTNKYINQERAKDQNYNYRILLIVDIESLASI